MAAGKSGSKRAAASQQPAKPTARKRSANVGKPGGAPSRGAPPSDADPKRRLGNFTGTGEAPRKGHRTTGIAGPQKRREAKNRAQKRG